MGLKILPHRLWWVCEKPPELYCNWVSQSALLSSEMHDLSSGQGLSLSPMGKLSGVPLNIFNSYKLSCLYIHVEQSNKNYLLGPLV